jgi:hypothetical protein
MICAGMAVLLTLGLAACGKNAEPVQLYETTGPTETYAAFTTTQPATEDGAVTEPNTTLSVEELRSLLAEAETAASTKTTANSASSERPTSNTGNSATTKTTKPTAAISATAATTKTTTTKPSTAATSEKTNAPAGDAIKITSSQNALDVFNTAIAKVLSDKPGYSKSHSVSYSNWNFDPNLFAGLPQISVLGSYEKMVSSAMNQYLNGLQTATAYKGESNSLLKASNFNMGNMRSVSSSVDGSNVIITLNVSGGETRQEKRWLGDKLTVNNSPIDSGPFYLATGSPDLYDHMRADRLFSLIRNGFSGISLGGMLNMEPIDIGEKTNGVKVVATIDKYNHLKKMVLTYDTTITLYEVKVLAGNDYKNSSGSGTVKVTWSDFSY